MENKNSEMVLKQRAEAVNDLQWICERNYEEAINCHYWPTENATQVVLDKVEELLVQMDTAFKNGKRFSFEAFADLKNKFGLTGEGMCKRLLYLQEHFEGSAEYYLTQAFTWVAALIKSHNIKLKESRDYHYQISPIQSFDKTGISKICSRLSEVRATQGHDTSAFKNSLDALLSSVLCVADQCFGFKMEDAAHEYSEFKLELWRWGGTLHFEEATQQMEVNPSPYFQ
jgi:hypothetical protein